MSFLLNSSAVSPTVLSLPDVSLWQVVQDRHLSSTLQYTRYTRHVIIWCKTGFIEGVCELKRKHRIDSRNEKMEEKVNDAVPAA